MKSLTSAEVITRTFPQCGSGGGYDKDEVRSLLSTLGEFLSAQEQGKEVDAYDAAQQVQNITISPSDSGSEGYDKDAVDSFLDKVSNTLIAASLCRSEVGDGAMKLHLPSRYQPRLDSDSGEAGRRVVVGILVGVSTLAVTAALVFDNLPF